MPPLKHARGRGVQTAERVSPADILYDPVVNITYSDDRIATVAKVFGGVTHTKTITRNGDGQITSISVWVESP